MSQIIHCNVDMFARTASIIYTESGLTNGLVKDLGDIDLEALSYSLPEICKNCNTYNLHFTGNENFINGIIDEMKTITYDFNKLIIEVN